MTDTKNIKLTTVISVKDLADKLETPVTRLVMMLMKNGIMATINESIDFETAAIVAEEFGFTAVLDNKKMHTEVFNENVSLEYRSPVVTIMGHVDHGKTTLIDRIRTTKVAQGESGGITQHISAYKVSVDNKSEHKIKTITFLDTPGHAAFSAMRQHGANITDIVILVVAANDGVKAQTIEAIDNAKMANVPIIVAINKIDLPEANIDRVKQQLAELEIVSEEWGGNNIFVPLSAKTGEGIDTLLDTILLIADMKEYKANYSGTASGVVVESHLETGRGPIATILIQNGQIHNSECISAGATYGKIRILEDYKNCKIDVAGPSDPVIITGLKSIPNFGDPIIITSSEKEAKIASERFDSENRQVVIHSLKDTRLEDSVGETSESKTLPIILKSDVKGSMEALIKSLADIKSDEVSIDIVSSGIGPVSESDVNMALASKAKLLAFRVPISSSIHSMASNSKVFIGRYDVIYELIDDIKKALSKLLPPEIIESTTGSAKVIALFRGDKRYQVVGVQINEGRIKKAATFHLTRGKKSIYDGEILKVKREKEEVNEAIAGQQAGLLLPGNLEVKEGDDITTYKIDYKEREIL